jgi:hypothetical protein
MYGTQTSGSTSPTRNTTPSRQNWSAERSLLGFSSLDPRTPSMYAMRLIMFMRVPRGSRLPSRLFGSRATLASPLLASADEA